MSFYGNITNYITDALKSGEVVTNPTGQEAGTYLALTFNTAAGTTQTVYINVKELNEVAGNDTSTIHIDVDSNQAITAYLKNKSITKEHFSDELTEQLNNISVVNGVLTIN